MHYIYTYSKNQLLEFLNDNTLSKKSKQYLLSLAIEQLKNCPFSYNKGL